MRENAPPAWAIKALADNEAQIAAKLGSRLLPVGLADEIGCGGIGCVWHTLDRGIVFKLSTEHEEFSFAVATLGMPQRPAGVARFYGAVELEQPARTLDGSLMAYGLWREWALATARESLGTTYANALDALSTAYNTAVNDFAFSDGTWPTDAQLRQASRSLRPRTVERDASAGFVHPAYTRAQLLVAMDRIESMLETMSPMRHVAGALRHFRRRRMLLHDINEDNVGLFRRGARDIYAIFDAHLKDYRDGGV